MKFFNIDEALKLPQTFNVLMDAMDELYAKRQEEFQKSNPLNEIYQTVTLNQFQKSFGSSTGFKQAFEQTIKDFIKAVPKYEGLLKDILDASVLRKDITNER